MRAQFALLVAIVGCATAQPQPASTGKPAARPAVSEYCNPCNLPCLSNAECGKPVAKAAAPAPAPAPKPTPPPPPVAQPSAAATFSPAPGTFTSPQTVELTTTTPGATIHYTTDGSEPTASSPAYSAPIPVDATTTIKAITVAPGMTPSEVASSTYTIEAAPPPPPPPPPPPAAPPRVELKKEKIEIKEKVFFDTGKATIQEASHGLLGEVADVLKDHPEVARVVVEGHTDNKGSAAANQKLSQARAEAVRAFLVEKGVEAARLEAKGFGASRPIADNKTAKGRDENRRVEFVIAPAK